MTTYIVLGVCGLLFFVLPIFLRSNAVYVLFCLLLGELVARMSGQDLTQIVNSLISVKLPVLSIVQIAVLVVLPLIILVMYRKAVKAPRLLWQVIPAASAALLAVMFVVAKLPYDLQTQIQNDQLYQSIEVFFPLAAIAGALVSFFYLLSRRPRPNPEDKKKKRHK